MNYLIYIYIYIYHLICIKYISEQDEAIVSRGYVASTAELLELDVSLQSDGEYAK